MRSPAVAAALVGVVFLLGGAALGGSALATAAAVVGFAAGYVLHRAGLRTPVIVAVAAAGVVGLVIGKTVVDALCLPGTCVPLSWLAAVLTAAGSLVGVGLVVALAVRSFEEHQAATRPDAPGDPRQPEP